jgi:ankyrin repeat protein
MLNYKDDKYLKLDSAMFSFIIESNPKNILINGIKSNYFSDRTKYKLILWTQNLDYFNIFGDDFDINIATNFLDEIIENCLIKSFYFLYKIDDTIINTVDSDGNTFLHIITEKNKYHDMIKILLKLDDGILYRKNKKNQTALMTHIENNNYNIVSILIDFIIESKNEHSFEIIDLNGNNILHYLCRSSYIDIIKKILPLIDPLLNVKNSNGNTPIIEAALNSQEDIIYLLKSINVDLNITDKYGNTVYHYICLNELCVGLAIENKENIFGYKPSDYCKLALNYYYFI